MYAIFEDGSRQYQASQGGLLKLDYRAHEPGAAVEFNRVLLYTNADVTHIGQPTVTGARVIAEVVEQTGTKLYIQRFRRRKNINRLTGHKQPYTVVRVKHILLAGENPPPPAAPKAEAPTETPAAPTETPAAPTTT
jgi:large subunit ribosomal protein L21